jgi:hypothetical protein
MVLSASILLTNQQTGSIPVDATVSSDRVDSPLSQWWVAIFQRQAKLEQALTHKLSIKLPKSQEVQVQTSLQNALVALRSQLQEAFQGFVAEESSVAWMGSLQREAVLGLITQQNDWAMRLEALLPEAKTKIAETQQFAFIETVVPRVLLSSQTVRILNSQSQPSTPALSLAGLTLLEERIGWLKATSPLAWGDLIQGSLVAVAEHYLPSFPCLSSLPKASLSAVLGTLLLGESYYFYWVTEALSNPALLKTSVFWDTEALLFEALQFFNTGSVQTTLWHQQVEALKPVNVQPKEVKDCSALFEALQTAIPPKLHATAQQAQRVDELQSKLKAGQFISAICQEDRHQLWETLNDATQPMDIYACLQQMTETPCDMKEMLIAVWLYQLQTQVPQWLAWMEKPTQEGWQVLTHQLIKHETSVLKSIETALLHKTVLGEEV